MPSRLLRRARASPPPARLVLAVKETIQGGLRESMHVDWMEPQLYRRVVQGSLGALVMYQAGAKPHPDDYEDAYTEALDRLVTTRGSPAQSFGEFKPTLRPPSLSALCRWLHSAMRGRDTFDLQALLTEAAAYEEASRLAGRVLSAHYGAMEAFVMQAAAAGAPSARGHGRAGAAGRRASGQPGAQRVPPAAVHETVEQLSEPSVVAEVSALVDAWEALMSHLRQAGLAALQAMND